MTSEICGAWGGCPLPKGHNLGYLDIPENHAPPTSAQRVTTQHVLEQYTREEPPHVATVTQKRAEFQLWLRTIKADVLRETANDLEAELGDFGPGNRNTAYGRAGLDLLQQLRYRADAIDCIETDGGMSQ